MREAVSDCEHLFGGILRLRRLVRVGSPCLYLLKTRVSGAALAEEADILYFRIDFSRYYISGSPGTLGNTVYRVIKRVKRIGSVNAVSFRIVGAYRSVKLYFAYKIFAVKSKLRSDISCRIPFHGILNITMGLIVTVREFSEYIISDDFFIQRISV